MSWVTSISSWKSVWFRYDGNSINSTVERKSMIALAILIRLDKVYPDFQFHTHDAIFLSVNNFGTHFQHLLNQPDGMSITAEAIGDNIMDDSILTFVKLEDGWLLTVTQSASVGDFYPHQKYRRHVRKLSLTELRPEGQLHFDSLRTRVVFSDASITNPTMPSKTTRDRPLSAKDPIPELRSLHHGSWYDTKR